MADPFVMTTITVTREFTGAEGGASDVVSVDVEGDDHLTLLLGMLEMAKDTLMREAMDG